jgi:subtilisin family serine protease
MSFGAPDASKAVRDAIDYANRNGVTMAASAGNDNTTDRQYPAGFDKVLSIAATNLLDMKAPFSNFGASIDVSAPGVAIITPYPGGYYAVVSGTSFSAPIVAGEAALMRSLVKKENLKDRIKRAVQKIDDRNPWMNLGGRVDIMLALQER